MIPLHALTLHRPWPMVMSTKRRPQDRFAIKPIENRGWPPPEWLMGRHFALHAGKHWDQDGADFIRDLWPEMPGSSADHPLGIVSVVRLVGRVTGDVGEPPQFAWDNDAVPDDFALDMRWFFGTHGWIVDDMVPIDPPVPCRGMQGLWKVPDAELAIVRERWRAAKAAVRT